MRASSRTTCPVRVMRERSGRPDAAASSAPALHTTSASSRAGSVRAADRLSTAATWIDGARLRQCRLVPSSHHAMSEALAAATDGVPYRTFMCVVCGFIYSEADGWPDDGIAPGTRWEDVPETWTCPDCGVTKSDFEMVEI